MEDQNNNNENPNLPVEEQEEAPDLEEALPDVTASQADAANHIPAVDFEAMIGSGANRDARSAADETRGSKLEWLEEEISDETVEANSILVPKNCRGESGSRDYLRNLDAATTPLEPKLGVPSHFVSSRDGETEAGNQTKHQYIQEVFVSNYDKLMQAMLRAENYDFMAIFMIPSLSSAAYHVPYVAGHDYRPKEVPQAVRGERPTPYSWRECSDRGEGDYRGMHSPQRSKRPAGRNRRRRPRGPDKLFSSRLHQAIRFPVAGSARERAGS